MRHSSAHETLLLLALTGLGITIFVIANCLAIQPMQQFVDLANSFFHGRLDFLPDAKSIYDASYFEGKYFWPLGPFPALLVIPMIAMFDIHFQLFYMQFFLIILIGYYGYKIGQKIIGESLLAAWLSFGFIFSTAFIGVAYTAASWQFAHVVATTLMFIALYELFYKSRWWLIGVLLASAIATRMNLIIAVLFFTGNALLTSCGSREKAKHLILLLFPVGISLMLLLLYNYFRFHNVFDQGYTMQTLTDPFLRVNRDAAVWGFIHMPANLYYFFFKGPDAVVIPETRILTYPYLKMDGWGMSIFFTSPMFVWIVKAPFKKKEVILASITALFIAFSVFGYYGIGFIQFGYRYAIDFYPFLFIILLYAIDSAPSTLLKAVIIFSWFFNSFLYVGSLLVALLTLAALLVALPLVVLFLWLTILRVRHWLRGARVHEDTRLSSKTRGPRHV
jgi:hypothetical protein